MSLRPSRTGTLISLVLVACSAEGPAPGDAGGDTPAAEATSADPTAMSMLALLEGRIETAEGKFLQLAEAIPEDRYDWRPMGGVRSFREVFIHIAADNWAPMWMGVPAPADVPVTAGDMESLAAYQDQTLSKQETLVELERSFAFLLTSLDQTRNRLGESVTFGGREWGIDEMWVALVTHMHEHLGQTIAYARANEIVPPWSR